MYPATATLRYTIIPLSVSNDVLPGKLKADSHIACRSPAMPCRYGFRTCLSYLIYTVRPCLIHTSHAMLRPCRSSQGHSTARLSTAVLYCGLEKKDMVGAWHGHGMTSVNQTRPHCVNQMGKTHSKPLVALHGRGTACYV